jgi:uncharacterized membrane protein YfcA
MTIAMAAGLGLLMVFTAFLSGIFGMAGGMVLIGVLLFLLPLPMAMVLHAVTQMRPTGGGPSCGGGTSSGGSRSSMCWVASLPSALVADALCSREGGGAPDAGLLAFCPAHRARTAAARDPGPLQAMGGGIACMALMLLTGVTGPLIDQLFLRSQMNRRQIVATKASCQVFGHGSKLLYFGALIEQTGSVEPWVLVMAVAASMLGTSLGKQILERLSDGQFRMWAGRLITVLGLYYVGYGLVLLTGIA